MRAQPGSNRLLRRTPMRLAQFDAFSHGLSVPSGKTSTSAAGQNFRMRCGA
jgi:hypothetical protein